MLRLLLICIAGAGGTGLRYLVSLWTAERFGSGFAYGTLFVNLGGCFSIALVWQLATQRADFSVDLRLTLTTGFIGGLTTYSAFNYETTKLLQSGAILTALVYLAATVLGCFAAGLAGAWLARATLS